MSVAVWKRRWRSTFARRSTTCWWSWGMVGVMVGASRVMRESTRTSATDSCSSKSSEIAIQSGSSVSAVWVEVEVVVVVQKTGANGATGSLGWPPGFFERVCGSITDDHFERWPQGTPDPPPSFE